MEPTPFDLPRHLQQHGTALRRLARELVRDRSRVDDVLQETWLQALRMPPRHERQVGGWLATILRNVVGRQRRGEQRRARREREALQGERDDDPVVRIERSEVARRLLAAVDALDVSQRDVIWQRYFEELPPREIAARTGVPLATVKSRLQRGLQQLRERLGEANGEGGESSDWRCALASAFGFEMAKGAATAATVAAWQGGVLMATGAKVAAVAGVAALAVWWLWPTSTPPAAASFAAVESATVAASETPAPTPPLERAEPAATAASAAQAATAEPASPPTGRLRGRVVAAESGDPLAGIEIYRRRGFDDIRWEPDETLQVTGADGCFEFEFRADRSPGLMLRGPGRLSCYWSGSRVAPGQVDDVGDLQLAPGRSVVGRLVDDAGTPVAARVLVEAFELPNAPTTLDGPLGAGQSRRQYGVLHALPAQVYSDGDGTFEMSRAFALGRCRWSILSGPFELAAPQETVLEPGDGPAHIELTARRRPEIRGVVLDEGGLPVAAVRVQAEASGGAVTGSDGRFVLDRRGDAGDAATLSVTAVAEFAPPAPLTGVPWGAVDVRITLRRPPGFALEVTDPTGAPIEEFGVVLDREGLLARGTVQQRGRHDAGRLSVRGVVPGATRLRVLPTAGDCTPSELLVVPESEPMRVVLQRRLPCTVRVLAAGQPVASTSVQLLHEHQPSGEPIDPTGERAWVPRRGGREVVAAGTTDAAGEVALLRDADATGRVLRIEVPGRRLHVVREPRFPDDGTPLLVELPSLGAVTGRVTLRDALRDAIRIELQGDARSVCTPEPDGSFAFRELPAGAYTIALLRSPRERLGAVLGSERSVEVRADAVTEVAFDLADFPLAHVRGHVRASGPLPPGLAVDCVRRTGTGRPEILGTAAVGADGVWHVSDLLPGEYLFALRTRPAREAWLPGLLSEVVLLPGGGEVQHDLSFRQRRLTVRFARADGGDADGLAIRARCGGVEWPGIVLFQARVDGPLVLDPAPALPVEFRVQAEGASWSEPVTMPPDRSEAEVTVVLPEPPTPR